MSQLYNVPKYKKGARWLYAKLWIKSHLWFHAMPNVRGLFLNFRLCKNYKKVNQGACSERSQFSYIVVVGTHAANSTHTVKCRLANLLEWWCKKVIHTANWGPTVTVANLGRRLWWGPMQPIEPMQ